MGDEPKGIMRVTGKDTKTTMEAAEALNDMGNAIAEMVGAGSMGPTVAFVKCDGCEVGAEIGILGEDIKSVEDFNRARDALEGWTQDGDDDYCPKHTGPSS